MKAYNKATGVLQEVAYYKQVDGVTFYINNDKMVYRESELEFIDWQQVRIQAAIAAMPKAIDLVESVITHGGKLVEESMAKQVAATAIKYADALVEELKKTNDADKTRK